MPETVLAVQLMRVQRRWQARSWALAAAIGGAAFAIALVAAPLLLGVSASRSLQLAAFVGVSVAIVAGIRMPRMSTVDAARAIERADRSLDNLVVTAAELEARLGSPKRLREDGRPVRAEIRDEVMRQAEERARSIVIWRAVPMAQPLTVTAVVLIACAILAGGASESLPTMMRVAGESIAGARAAGDFDVRVIPPAYTRRPSETFSNPMQITVLTGSRIQIAAIGRDWIADTAEAITIRASAGAEPRFLSIMVTPDHAPSIRIVTPGKDTAQAEPVGRVPIAIQSGDDLGLTSVSLRYTKASGGGENVSFTDGEVPLRLERISDREWRATADLSLETLGLADGDILVYRAMARDTNPAGEPVQSDQYVIEIGKNFEIADAGFALPAEERKYAISQQMVIYRTEQLLKSDLARRRKGEARLRQGSGEAGSEWLTESRGLAMDQRMVRAEVVFLGGGEVEDEVEEAAHSHELAEGRLENAGRVEMLRAINAMSRAEAQLNDGNVEQALVFEREALVHLERALDRRRYFLRTLPDRSRIDTTRRLTGERREARSWERSAAGTPVRISLDARRRVMRDLASLTGTSVSLAARLAAIDPSSTVLQAAAVTLASATTDASRQEAANAAMAALTNYTLQLLPSSVPAGVRLDPLAGQLADELRPRQ